MHCNVLPDELQHHTLLLGHSLPQKYFSKKYTPPLQIHANKSSHFL
jgi:hypothetical protein